MAKRRDTKPPVADEAAVVPAGRDGGCLGPVVAVAHGFARCGPVETKDFTKAAEGDPRLRDDLDRLTKTYPPSDLVALANALAATARAARRDGPRLIAEPDAAVAPAKLWGNRIAELAASKPNGRRSHAARAMMNSAISEVAPRLPHRDNDAAQRARARRLIDRFVRLALKASGDRFTTGPARRRGGEKRRQLPR